MIPIRQSCRMYCCHVKLDPSFLPFFYHSASTFLSPLFSIALSCRHELEKALEGHLREHHRLILKLSIQVINSYDKAIERLDTEIDQRMEVYRQESQRLQTIPGVEQKTAESIVAEIGVDMSRFPSDAHISSWAGVSPGNNESAGKLHSGRSTPGNKWLKGTLTEAAWEPPGPKKLIWKPDTTV